MNCEAATLPPQPGQSGILERVAVQEHFPSAPGSSPGCALAVCWNPARRVPA